jgi:hypothetical protein
MALNQACSFFIKGCCIGVRCSWIQSIKQIELSIHCHENPAPTYSCEDIGGHSKKMKHSLKKRKMENKRQTKFIRIHSKSTRAI